MTRTGAVVKSSVVGGAAQAANMAVSLALVPLTVGFLGAERFGVWMAIVSIMAWARVADFGIGHALTNAIATRRDDGWAAAARSWISSALALVLAIDAALTVAAAAVLWRIDWTAILGLASPEAVREAPIAICIALGLFLLELPLVPLDRVAAAVGAGATWNLFVAAGHVSSLAGAAVAARQGAGLQWVVGAFFGSRLAATALASLWLFWRLEPDLRPTAREATFEKARGLGRVGAAFLAIQLAALVLYSSDNLVISAVLGAAKVTPYSIAWRLFLIPPAAMAVVFPFLWPAYAEAIASGDREWVFRTLRLTTLGAATVGGVLSLALVVTGERVIATLAGVENVPPFPVLAWMGAWSFLLSWMNAIACFLNAAGQLRVQAVFGAIGAGANVLLSIAWAREYGLSGVIAATVVTYALVIVGPSLAEARRTYRRLAEG